MSSVISAADLKIGYSSDAILAEVDNLEIKQGEIVSIIGKSEIENYISKKYCPFGKSNKRHLKVFDSIGEPERGVIGYIPQKLGLIKHETVYSNVLEGAICHESKLKSLSVFSR